MALSRRSGGRSRLTIGLLLLTSLALITLDFRDAAIVRSARSTAGTALSPLRGAAEWASEPFTTAWHGVTDYSDVQAENDRLRRELDDLAGRQVLEEDAVQQLAELLEQQGLEWVGAIPTSAARVLSGAPSNFTHSIDISKGSDDGIKVGMPVVNGAGLVGRVVLVTNQRSTVQLITDPDFAVGIRLLPSQVPGTARGQGRGRDLMVDTNLEAETEEPPKAGVSAVTSGVDRSAFPASIPVGKVREVRAAGGGLTLDLVLRPLADTDELSFVTVLLWEPPE
ncbi:MAG: rod shape-determining protein MreC [Acidimicrobiales bacterium]|nr:rod shape-determining protein MreC [Acidimicrobiales bacterium]